MKYDSNGNSIWTKQFGTGGDDKINWLALDQIGNVYVTGCTNGVLDEILHRKYRRQLISKYRKAGRP